MVTGIAMVEYEMQLRAKGFADNAAGGSWRRNARKTALQDAWPKAIARLDFTRLKTYSKICSLIENTL